MHSLQSVHHSLYQVLRKHQQPLDIAADSTLLLFLIPQLFPVAFALAAAIIVAAVLLIRRQSVEFEYIQNASDLEVDKIYAKSTRKGMCEIDLKSVEAFDTEVRTARELKREFSAVHDCAGSEGTVYSLVFPGEEGREILLFTPSEKLLDTLRRVISPRIWKKL